jgi:hypothetical protein
VARRLEDRARSSPLRRNDRALASRTKSGDLPQNVNFALKASIIASFLDIHGIKYTPGSATSAFKPEELADQAKSMSVFILCKWTLLRFGILRSLAPEFVLPALL